MHNINTRISEWAKNSVLLSKVLNKEQLDKLIDDAFCDNQDDRTIASIDLYFSLWGTYPVLGPCPDIKELSVLEHDRIFHPDYRDHVSHTIKTFFLGLYLYEKNDTIRENIDSRLKEFELFNAEDSFMLTWTMTSLFHDIGYFLENETVEHTEHLKKRLLENINEKMALPLSSTKYFSDELNPKKESYCINKNEIFTPKISSFSELEDDEQFQILSDFSKKSGLSVDSNNNGIQRYYQYAKSHPPTPHRKAYSDHGIVSALVMLKIWYAYDGYFNKIASRGFKIFNGSNTLMHKLKDVYGKLTDVKELVNEAAGAIAIHNIRKEFWKAADTLPAGIDIDRFLIKLNGNDRLPFAFLLRMADELQCWDRSTYSMPEKNKLSLRGEDIDILVTSSGVNIWFKTDEQRFRNPETDAGSTYRGLITQLSKHLDISVMAFSFYASDEKSTKTPIKEQNIEGGNCTLSKDFDIVSEKQVVIVDSKVEYLKETIKEYNEIIPIYSDLKAMEIGSNFNNIIREEAQVIITRTFIVNSLPLLSHTFENPQDPMQVEGFNEIFEYFCKNKRIALTGEPGSGKSTTLQFAAHKFATMYLEKKSGLIPALVDLGGMSGESVENYLSEHIDERVRNLLDTEKIILLLDGFNEVSAQDAEQLTKWIDTKPNQCLIVTCRRADYIERQLPLRRIDIEPLNVMQIWEMMFKYIEGQRDKLFWSLAGSEAKKAWNYYTERYTGSDPFQSFWYDDIGSVRSFETEKYTISVLQSNLREQKMPGVLPLLSNPFLLSAAILLYSENQGVPRSRMEVLTGFAILMLKKAEISSRLLQRCMQQRTWADLGIDSSSLASDPASWIAYCAFRMFKRGGGTAVPLSWLQDELMSQFPNEPVGNFIENLIAGNLLEKFGQTTPLVKFRYQIMQEFFAAIYLCVTNDYNKLSTIFASEKWWEPSAWDETIRITAELLHDATALIQSLCIYKPDLAYSCILQGSHCKEDIRQMLLNPSDSDAPASPRARAAWGESLVINNKTDSREGVGNNENGFPNFKWIKVEHGRIKVGIDIKDSRALGVAGNATPVEIDDDFYISQYPTTRLQFNAFLQDGYEDKQNWSDLGWRWKGTRSYPELWDNSGNNLDNAPVVGVSWFEAMAFCKWASRKLTEEGWEIDLPLEAEWEYAARFPDGRVFPWGNTYLPGHANIDESAEGASCGPFSLGKPTSVGIYSQGLSVLGIADMCGNVWEWCKNRWDVRYEWPETVVSEMVDHRVVKGGSWYNSVRFANLGVHDCLDADLGVNDVGFRVVKKKSCKKSKNLQVAMNSINHTVRKILVLGTPDSGRTEFVRSVGDFPLQVVHKKDSSGAQIQMDYGRKFHNDYMNYFYAPLEADNTNLSRFINEMHGVIFILSGLKNDRQINKENLSLMSKLCESCKIPILVGVSGFDLPEFYLNKSDKDDLTNFGVTFLPFTAIDRLSCTKLLDVLFE